MDNRRLFAYKTASIKSVPVEWASRSSMTHEWTGNGIDIVVRGGSRYQ